MGGRGRRRGGGLGGNLSGGVGGGVWFEERWWCLPFLLDYVMCESCDCI